MSIPRESASEFTSQQFGSLKVSLARHQDEIEASQRLRNAIFNYEMGAKLPRSIDNRDVDEFDPLPSPVGL